MRYEYGSPSSPVVNTSVISSVLWRGPCTLWTIQASSVTLLFAALKWRQRRWLWFSSRICP